MIATCAVFGYPHEKPGTLLRIMALEKLRSDEVLVVGDGESDRKSAVANGLSICSPSKLRWTSEN